ncbi:GNAT family N-acetyltransferase [Taibaiella helva]|uniref:GNAT family N-acetyltransferase n=1 Tax=Taibaiella helva TaxID=2301235 RepID=UPI000E588453|nr:GNAT family N-acetyltransferase [Taibaiella helva]
MVITESSRLRLEQFTVADSSFIIALLNSEGWLAYIGDRNVRTEEQACAYLEQGPIQSYSRHGFGLSKVVLKASETPVGMCGLVRRDFLAHADLGFAFLPAHMGQGYAFEIAARTLEQSFATGTHDVILAITLPNNTACIRLLLKLGFKRDGTVVYPGTEEALELYRLTHDDFYGQMRS